MPTDYLERVREQNEQRLLSIDNVVAVSTSNFGEPHALVLYVADKSEEAVASLPTSVDHVAVRIEEAAGL